MNLLLRFLRHAGGVSATEFAVACPILALVMTGIGTGWTYSSQLMEMRSAIKSGANYVLQGGTDLVAAKNAVLISWMDKPENALVQVVRQCSCAGTVSVCTSVCAGNGSIPNMSVIISASGQLDAPLYDMFTSKKMQASRQEIIRVR